MNGQKSGGEQSFGSADQAANEKISHQQRQASEDDRPEFHQSVVRPEQAEQREHQIGRQMAVIEGISFPQFLRQSSGIQKFAGPFGSPEFIHEVVLNQRGGGEMVTADHKETEDQYARP